MSRGSAPRVAIGNINAGSLRTETVASIINSVYGGELAKLDVEVDTVLMQPCGPYLDDGRNKIVQRFLETDAEALLFVDSDIEFAAADVAKLVHWAAKAPEKRCVAGGVYGSPMEGQFIAIAYNLAPGRHGDKTYTAIPISEIRDARRTPVKVDAIGTGFMLIQRWLLEAMPEYYDWPQPWFAELVVDAGSGGVHLGEDLTFCARVQALGYPIWLHRGVRVKHYKTVGIDVSYIEG